MVEYPDPSGDKVRQHRAMSTRANQYATVSDADGLYALSGDFSDSIGFLNVQIAGARGEPRVQIEAEQTLEGIDVIIKGGVSLLGQVLNAEGHPVAGAHVEDMGYSIEFAVDLSSSQAGTRNSSITDDEGLFEFFYRGAGVWISLDAEQSMATLDGGEVSTITGGVYGVESLVDGRFEIARLASGIHYSATLRNAKNDSAGSIMLLSPKVELGEMGPGEAKRWDYTIQNPVRITGNVTGEADGKPLAAMAVWIDGDATTRTMTASDGSYELITSVQPGIYRVWPMFANMSQHDAKDLFSKEIELDYGDEVELSFTLPDPCSVRLGVVDHLGAPIADASVSMDFRVGNAQSRFKTSEVTDRDGIFEWTQMPLVGMTRFLLQADGRTQTQSQEYRGESGAVFPEEVIVIYEKSSVEGYATDSNGDALAFQDLVGRARIGGEVSSHFMVTTAEDGYFIIKDEVAATRVELVFGVNGSFTISNSMVVDLEAETITSLGSIQLNETRN